MYVNSNGPSEGEGPLLACTCGLGCRSLQEEVKNKLENPVWLIKIKNARENFEKDAKNDMKKHQTEAETDAFAITDDETRKSSKGKHKKTDTRKTKTKKHAKSEESHESETESSEAGYREKRVSRGQY